MLDPAFPPLVGLVVAHVLAGLAVVLWIAARQNRRDAVRVACILEYVDGCDPANWRIGSSGWVARRDLREECRAQGMSQLGFSLGLAHLVRRDLVDVRTEDDGTGSYRVNDAGTVWLRARQNAELEKGRLSR